VAHYFTAFPTFTWLADLPHIHVAGTSSHSAETADVAKHRLTAAAEQLELYIKAKVTHVPALEPESSHISGAGVYNTCSTTQADDEELIEEFTHHQSQPIFQSHGKRDRFLRDLQRRNMRRERSRSPRSPAPMPLVAAPAPAEDAAGMEITDTESGSDYDRPSTQEAMLRLLLKGQSKTDKALKRQRSTTTEHAGRLAKLEASIESLPKTVEDIVERVLSERQDKSSTGSSNASTRAPTTSMEVWHATWVRIKWGAFETPKETLPAETTVTTIWKHIESKILDLHDAVCEHRGNKGGFMFKSQAYPASGRCTNALAIRIRKELIALSVDSPDALILAAVSMAKVSIEPHPQQAKKTKEFLSLMGVFRQAGIPFSPDWDGRRIRDPLDTTTYASFDVRIRQPIFTDQAIEMLGMTADEALMTYLALVE
jgi:hypothetical protein